MSDRPVWKTGSVRLHIDRDLVPLCKHSGVNALYSFTAFIVKQICCFGSYYGML
jgi:hypothetical protein